MPYRSPRPAWVYWLGKVFLGIAAFCFLVGISVAHNPAEATLLSRVALLCLIIGLICIL